MPKVKRSSSQCQPASTRGRGRGSAQSILGHGRGSASTRGRGREYSCTLSTPPGDSGPSASLDGSTGEELPVHMDRLMANIHAEVEKITQLLGVSSSSAGAPASSVGAPSVSADHASAGGLQSSVGQQSMVPPQLALMSYPGSVRRSFM